MSPEENQDDIGAKIPTGTGIKSSMYFGATLGQSRLLLTITNRNSACLPVESLLL